MLHGDLAQAARTEVLDRLRRGDLRLLVCSDVAARGLDIQDLSHVFNFDVPTHPEDYVHRIGRTGRAGRTGKSLSIALPEDGKYVAEIEKLIGKTIPRINVDGIADADLHQGEGRRRRRSGRTAPEQRSAESKPAPRPSAAPKAARPVETDAQQPPKPAARPQPRRGAAVPPPPRPPQGEMIASSRPQSPVRRQRGSGRQRGQGESPVVGMGDHIPAFMLREVKLQKKD
jgi:superfamily II DNA/RNA helicase